MKMIRTIAWWIFLAAIPVALFLQFTHGDKILLFIASAMAVLPVAAWIGHSTEHLAVRMGSTLGALFNATFGNLAEMIIAILAIRAGLPEVVKASLPDRSSGTCSLSAGWRCSWEDGNGIGSALRFWRPSRRLASSFWPWLRF